MGHFPIFMIFMVKNHQIMCRIHQIFSTKMIWGLKHQIWWHTVMGWGYDHIIASGFSEHSLLWKVSSSEFDDLW